MVKLLFAVYYAGGNRPTGPSPSVISGFESIFGYNRGDLDFKLLHMLNYGNLSRVGPVDVGGTANRWWNMQAPLDATGNNFYSQRRNFNLSVNLSSCCISEDLSGFFSLVSMGKC